MTAPAVATTIVACGPRSSSAVKSITKDGGMMAQSFAVDCCIARADDQHRSQDQTGELESPVRLRPARQPKEHPRPNRDDCERHDD